MLRRLFLLPFLTIVVACGAKEPAMPEASGDPTCAVWDRETSFAKSVEAHDTRAFAEHVHPGAVFIEGNGQKLTRGRDAVVASWQGILKGEGFKFFWRPTSVVPTGAPGVVVSRGPYVIEFTKPDAPQRFKTGLFQSVWVRDTDGQWRVVLDGGPAPPPAPATEEEAARLKAAIPERCTP